MANLGNIVYLTEAQKNELFALGSVTSNGRTVTYSANDLYITPDKSIDKIMLNGTNYTALNGMVNLGNVLTSANNSIIAPVEDSTTASQLYNVGDLFVYNDNLYKATSTIATSTTIIPNTNCTITNVNQEFVHDVQVNGTSVVSNGVANIPIANTDTFGTIKINSAGGIDINSETGKLRIASANGSEVRLGTDAYRPIVPSNEHTAVFYGLAKAAGDTTQRSIVFDGTYTNEAKAAIQSMLGIQSSVYLTESVTGTTLSITADPNVKYICGEATTLSITPPANGTCDIIFESGSTATTLTVPNTVKWPTWFDATSLETNTIYELMITDATYGSVMTWATT